MKTGNIPLSRPDRNHQNQAMFTQRKTAGSAALRANRWSIPGNYYFLTSVSAQRMQLFHGKVAKAVLRIILNLNERQAFQVDAAVVMPDHIHIAGLLRQGSLDQIMQQVKSVSAHELVRAHSMKAPVWQPGFHDHGVRTSEDYRQMMRYLLNNPVRAGLVSDFRDHAHWWCRFTL